MFRGLYFLGNNCIIPYKFHSAYSLHVDYSPQNDHSLFSDYTLCSMYFHPESFSYYICRELSSSDILKIFSDTWISAHYICEICSKHILLIHIFRIFFLFQGTKKVPGYFPGPDDANEIRTRDTTVKGWCLNRLTMAPKRGESRIRTGAQGVADPCLTTWLSRHKIHS